MAKQTRSKTNFTTIRVEGAILPADLLERISKHDKDIKGLREEEDYHLSGEKFKDAITQSWNRLRGAWTNFQNLRSKLTNNDTGTTITREKWLLPLFQQLGYGRLNPTKKSFDIDEKSYPISHLWQQIPIHLVGCNIDLDKRSLTGTSRSSSHSMLQEFLNRSKDYLWAFVSNGLKLRILRDNISLTRQAYVEFDLESMMQGEIYPDFVLLWLLCHESRVESEKCEDFWLEKWSKTAQEQGTRFLEKLRKGVETAISQLGSGFLAHPNNKSLRTKLQTGKLNAQDYYRQLLRLVYRLLFLFVAEDRDLLLDPNANNKIKERYTKYYSTIKLRKLAGKRKGTKHSDLWQGLRIVMQKLGNGGCAELALPALGSFLFSNRALPDLEGCEIDNITLLETFRALAHTEDGNSRRPVDYKNLRSEELGSVYESLLELHPIINAGVDIATFELKSVSGNERKTTGSYYTPESLVQCLLDSALDPVVDDTIKGLDQAKAEAAILNLKICDPACGSGHFLVAAAHRMAKRLASIRTGDSEPSPTETQKALRDVIGRCIYGVDINEMAVELCKVALWMEAIEPGKPLSFLEHHIQCGNSLLGTTPALMANGIPDEAFSAIEGDDKKEVTALKKRNQKERSGQESMFAIPGFVEVETAYEKVSQLIIELDSVDDDSIQNIKEKQRRYENLISSKEYYHTKLLANAWCSAFVWKKTKDSAMAITEGVFRQLKNDPSSVFAETLLEIDRLSQQYKFFHWHISFPGVFSMPKDGIAENKQAGWNGGFDIVLGNPPWEKIQIEEKHFFSSDLSIAQAEAFERKKMIKELSESASETFGNYLLAIRETSGQTHFLRTSMLFPLTGKGNISTHSLFIELSLKVSKPKSYIGLVVPSGLATQDNQKELYSHLVSSGRLRKLFDFENRKKLFPDVDSRMKFCLTIIGEAKQDSLSEYAFYLQDINDLKDINKTFSLNYSDLQKISPNALSCPTLRNKHEARIFTTIYSNSHALLSEKLNSNPWGWHSWQMFNETHENKELINFQLDWQKLKLDKLYEAKLFHHFDHRYATYDFRSKEPKSKPILDEEKNNPLFFVNTKYCTLSTIWKERVSKIFPYQWIMAFRKITNSTNERTSIFTIIPKSTTGSQTPVATSTQSPRLIAVLVANLNSYPFDFATRQKVGGTDLNHFIIHQLPIITPSQYETGVGKLFFQEILNRVLELIYTAWDLEPFAKDCGYEGPPFKWDERRRFLIRAELDAAYFHLYQIARNDVDYIMETFPIVKRKDEQKYGEYRTKRVILEVYDAMADAMKIGVSYQTIVSPPPADASVAHQPR